MALPLSQVPQLPASDLPGQGEPVLPIARHSLHEAIVGRLRDLIIAGELEPGAKINEAQMGTQLGVSRTPLREAIKFLASEGLVELIPSRGAVVKKFTAKEIHDMLEVIRALEIMAVGSACATASPASVAALRQMHDRMIAAYQQGDRMSYYKLNQAIHISLVALADNSALSDVHSMLQTRLKRIRFIGHEGPEKWAAAVGEHIEMIEALEARDCARLQEVVGRHLSLAWERVREAAPL